MVVDVVFNCVCVWAKQGSMSFTAQQNGIHSVCVSLDTSNYALPEDASMVQYVYRASPFKSVVVDDYLWTCGYAR